MKIIKLTKGKLAIVDDDNYDELIKYKWYCNSGGYALRRDYTTKDKIFIWMHRLINNTPRNLETDHVNGNRLDNRKSNLRSCTIKQNRQNRSVNRNKINTKYKGIHLHGNNWRAQIKINGILKTIGMYKSEIDAACAYDKYAKKEFGEFAKCNF